MPFQKRPRPRLAVLSIILAIIFLFYTVRVFSLQISNAETYINQALGISKRTVTIKAQRGEILDQNGRRIAVNREGYNIVFNKSYLKTENLNSTILSLSRLLKKHDTEWFDLLPITKTAPFKFTEDAAAVEKLKKTLDLAHYATAQNCIDKMFEAYTLENFDQADLRTIMGVRYTIQISDYSISNPYTFAEDVSPEIMQIVLESGMMLSGVSVDVVPFREYVDGTLAPHIIGTVGPIYAEEWDKYKDKNYSFSDKVGKSGIEQLAEEYLHGQDGEITYKIDSKGNILGSEVTKKPVAGKTVVLTLDKSVQKATQEALKNTITDLQSRGGTVIGGAAVMMNVKSGNIITSANYPSYDLNTYTDVYSDLLANPHLPLTDRAFSGIYPPGSTVKPVVAIAALENQKLEFDEHIRCVRTYKYFSDYTPSCMRYHGSMGLTSALSKSCNYYFYELGKRLGVSKMLEYFNKFGLGVSTGLDLPSSSGLMINADKEGLGGATLQTAIGQMNAFTPLQLATFVSTLASEGTRYKPNLIEKVVSYDMRELYDEIEPTKIVKFDIDSKVISAVKAGMLSVTEDGTGSAVFGKYSIKVGGKTGTSQVSGKTEHSVFIAFAPFDNPEIAISVILEHANSTPSVTSVAKAMLDAYFFTSEESVDTTPPFTVLK
ncbi:MAG: hypothetical protein J6V50_02570 [Clostridia bacterium]|nr:hypothetical protein [Clostridia bacterium]